MRAGMEAALREARGETDLNSLDGNANMWADKAKNMEQFGYDADAEAERWWEEVGAYTIGGLAYPAKS